MCLSRRQQSQRALALVVVHRPSGKQPVEFMCEVEIETQDKSVSLPDNTTGREG